MIVLTIEDLKNDYCFIVSFDDADDMLYFFSRYNPNSIHIVSLTIRSDENDKNSKVR